MDKDNVVALWDLGRELEIPTLCAAVELRLAALFATIPEYFSGDSGGGDSGGGCDSVGCDSGGGESALSVVKKRENDSVVGCGGGSERVIPGAWVERVCLATRLIIRGPRHTNAQAAVLGRDPGGAACAGGSGDQGAGRPRL